MATGTAKPGSPAPQPSRGPRRGGRVVEYQQYIDAQLGRTRRRVQWVDLWTALTTLAVGFVAFLLVAAVIDHWIVPGGLGTVGRWLLLVALLSGCVLHLVSRIGPVFLRRVNPVYAAAAIEQGGRMKNTLINFLLLRREPEAIPDGVLEAMKEQAAVRLSNVPDDAPVDRTALIRWFYVLAAILVAAVVYAFASPKDSFRSIRRVMSPWSDLAAPTRVRFESITPGNVDKHRDEIVEVVVRAAGLRAGDAVVLYYSPTGKIADEAPLPMQGDSGRYLWKAVLPPGSEGLKQDLFYRVSAGDAASEPFRIRVLATPVINVRAVRYDYPAYTELPPRTVEKQGDLKALEGTTVTLVAETNQPIRSAHVAFDQARNKDVELTPDGLQATGRFELALSTDRTKSRHSSYVLRFTNIDGEENPKPVEHRIDVNADQPPEVRVVSPNAPPQQELKLPLDGLLEVELAARDPDFRLAALTVVCQRSDGRALREDRLLAEPRYGEVAGRAGISAAALHLQVGDRFQFFGRATDNKTPKPNVVETPRYTVVVTPGDGREPPPNQNPQDQPNNGANQDPQNRQQPGGGDQGRNEQNREPPPPNGDKQPSQPNQPENQAGRPPQDQTGDGRPGENQPPGERDGEKGPQGDDPNAKPGEAAKPEENQGPNQSGERRPDDAPRDPIDPDTNPGDLIDRLNEHFEQKDREKQNTGNGQQDRPPENGDAPEPPKFGEQLNEPQQPDRGDGSQPMPPEKTAEPKPSEPKNDGDQPPMPPQPGEQPQDGSQPGGDKPAGNPQDGAPPQKSGDQKDDGNQPGEKPADKPGDGDQKTGSEQKPGNEQNGKPENNSEQPGGAEGVGGAKNEQPQQKNGPQGGEGAEERQTGGSDQGVGRETGDKGGEKGTGGAPQNQPSTKAADEATKPGGERGAKNDQSPPNGGTERRPGENDGGREVERRPDDSPGAADGESKDPLKGTEQPVDPNDRTKQGSGAQQGDKPNNDKAGKQPGTNQPGDQPDAGKPDGAKPKDGERPDAEGKESNPNVERQPGSTNSTGGVKSGGDESKPNEKAQRPGEPTPDGEPAQQSANDKQPGGNNKNPGGPDGKAPKEGTPDQNDVAKPRDKTGSEQSDNQQEPSDKEKSPGSNSKHESDAQGSTSGDRSGKGEDGAGQKSEQKGTGAAGENTAGEEGGAIAGEEGKHATGDKAGDKVRSDDPSKGKPSEQPGEGTETERGGDKSGGPSQGSAENPDPSQTGRGELQTGAGPGGGGDGERKPTDPQAGPVVPPKPDEANLDYARQVTDLTLDRLKQELGKSDVDPEVLKHFGSREAADAWVRKMEQLRSAAQEPGPAGEQGRQKWQETLKAMGLRPSATSQQSSSDPGDDYRAGPSGYRSAPPAKFADQYRAFRTSIGRNDEGK